MQIYDVNVIFYNMTLTKEEYLDLVTKLVDEQYGKEIDTEPVIDRGTLFKHKDDVNKKYRETPNTNTIINATDYKKEEIKTAILRSSNLRIGNFLIKIIKHNYNSDDEDGMPMTYDLNIYEESACMYLNRPSKRLTKLTPSKDSRMDTRPWCQDFSGSDRSYGMSLDSLLDMTRWLQAMGKMAAFL